MKTYIYSHNGKEFKVNVTKKHTRYTRFYFRNGEFFITAPFLQTEAGINKGIDKFFDKLVKENPHENGFTECSVYLLGERFDYVLTNELTFSDGSVIKYKSKEDLEKKLKKWFLSYITSRTRYYEQLMKIKAMKVSVRKMTSRYGSNSRATNTVHYATVLMHFIPEVIDSVVVHELAHCYQRNHSQKFYDVVFKYYPNYKKYHTMLRKGIFK